MQVFFEARALVSVRPGPWIVHQVEVVVISCKAAVHRALFDAGTTEEETSCQKNNAFNVFRKQAACDTNTLVFPDFGWSLVHKQCGVEEVETGLYTD